ncbi:hypothetical protein CGMCC3_g15809 [Colletotrichum fructicola]|uniref:Uncharacterized protein n=1 Tax=Colletotrichum fructicola (strain Nara gc5) TaxID=1213859 RepID=A0A7J6IDN0_COLFN|nr:uncharacterized protein CGMCC3_g15809 [Colletotrichum fructicola]KAF4473970.1 hypothetical protein CGGC5_v016910 [Colletotrichum fructicola Nara gc5]KAE9568028.1 hypothetical protein CGMCC3_g15809 [Colletotrichum fructicola]KAF4417874.1 hypothetical protein CFRS1_v015100 [Colletotrichum fructicola]KAF4418773.1 hypothetical protein CFRS1_v014976 [Colletotrichum fructicola]KAF4881040.1 hypothetical protein CGCFRS4_v015953 [Colletotrichum fructicola]
MLLKRAHQLGFQAVTGWQNWNRSTSNQAITQRIQPTFWVARDGTSEYILSLVIESISTVAPAVLRVLRREDSSQC